MDGGPSRKSHPTSNSSAAMCAIGARWPARWSGVDKVVHLAAEVGVGQSMYAIDRYVSVNDLRHRRTVPALIDQPVGASSSPRR